MVMMSSMNCSLKLFAIIHDCPNHTLSKLYDVPIGFVPHPSFEAVYCFFAVAEVWLLLDIG